MIAIALITIVVLFCVGAILADRRRVTVVRSGRAETVAPAASAFVGPEYVAAVALANHAKQTHAPYRASSRSTAYTAPAVTRHADDDGFITSMLIAEATDSPMLGTLAGGIVAGAIVGEMMAESSHHDSFTGSGGESAGGGASSSWADTSSSSSDYGS